MKKASLILFGFVFLLVLIRILYVNITYPNASFRYVSSESELQCKDFEINIESSTMYDKEQWKTYIESEGFIIEEKKNKITSVVNAAEIDNRDYDYLVNYNPAIDYSVYMFKVRFTNIKDTKSHLNTSSIMNIVKSVSDSGIHYDKYYYKLLNEDINDNIEPGESVTRTLVYISNNKYDKLYAQVITLGNYQMKEIEMKHVK